MAKVREEDVLKQFGQGFDCSQVVLSHFADQCGIEGTLAKRVAAAFGGGMWKGRTCGAVSGALMAIGLLFGHTEPDDRETKQAMLDKKAEFEKRFQEQYGCCVCREILGYDLSTPEGMQKIGELNLLADLCPKVVVSAIEILEDLFSDDRA